MSFLDFFRCTSKAQKMYTYTNTAWDTEKGSSVRRLDIHMKIIFYLVDSNPPQ